MEDQDSVIYSAVLGVSIDVKAESVHKVHSLKNKKANFLRRVTD
jgi:hypothetical protein